ncbi:hypothetical protein AHF37_12339 [Paragonimus kellicotti]|nr:hypothetical protein AHF37_12339 [Paragonimus kellicotti]
MHLSTPLVYIRFFPQLELICCYLFELSLTELSAVGVAASLRCAAAVRLVRQLLRMQRLRTATSSPDVFISPDNASVMDDWPETLTRSVGYEDTTQLRAMCLVYLRALMRFRAGGASCAEKYEVSDNITQIIHESVVFSGVNSEGSNFDRKIGSHQWNYVRSI